MDINSFLIGFQKGKAIGGTSGGASGGTSGGGSGGGSLPAGLYLKPYEIRSKNNYYQNWFWWNGELYAISMGGKGVSWSDFMCYKWDGVSDWVSVFSSSTNYAGVMYHALHNGKIHFMGDDSKRHVSWDGGSSFTTHADLPESLYQHGFCSHNGKLLAYSRSDNNIYEWDESADSWSIFCASGTTAYTVTLFSFDGELYLRDGYAITKYSDGSFTEYATTEFEHDSIPSWFHNGCLYYDVYKTNYDYDFVKYDVKNKVETIIGKWNRFERPNCCFSDISSDNLRFIAGGNNAIICYEIVEVAET